MLKLKMTLIATVTLDLNEPYWLAGWTSLLILNTYNMQTRSNTSSASAV